MKPFSRGLALVVATIALVFAVSGNAAKPGTVSNVYTVGVQKVPGVDTGLLLKKGRSVTVTATGAACPHDPSVCVGPDGDPSVDTPASGGWLLPGAPAWGLVGRVGDGPWVQVGSGPTTLSGSGDLVFAMNDQLNAYGDNSGSFTVTVTTTSKAARTCWPGWGYGDVNHEHCGPPGLANKPSPGHSGPPGTHGNSHDDGNGQSNDNANSNSSSQGNAASNGKGAGH